MQRHYLPFLLSLNSLRISLLPPSTFKHQLWVRVIKINFVVPCVPARILNDGFGCISTLCILLIPLISLLLSIRSISIFNYWIAYCTVIFWHILPLVPLLLIYALIDDIIATVVHRLFVTIFTWCPQEVSEPLSCITFETNAMRIVRI